MNSEPASRAWWCFARRRWRATRAPSRMAEGEGVDGVGRPPSPLAVRFVNDNVLINGRSSMPTRPNRQRIANLKLQFDDSLTRTFEYPSETSLCEESPSSDTAVATSPATCTATSPATATTPTTGTLAANTHLVSGSLGRYTPSKTHADSFQLGLTRPHAETEQSEQSKADAVVEAEAQAQAEAEAEAEAGDARPCAAHAARSWSDARALSTDLLF
ncbi:unnamed protein product [Parnassius apollo]|uniref:(apollo) hypothetical protein n=1 Tax=Parnassius apollo TaxID=110799 RepID=A0A8S3XNI3_PARAO|nr:unnamed protein product [Parnassius apollo]